MRCSNALATSPLSRRRRRRLRGLPIIPCWPPQCGRRTFPEPVSLKRLAAARFVFILGMRFLWFLERKGGGCIASGLELGPLFFIPLRIFWGARLGTQATPHALYGKCPARHQECPLSTVLGAR